MHILDRYIARQILMATFFMILVVVALDMVFSTLDEFNHLSGDYQALEAAMYVAMRIPRRIYDFLPISCLIGCMAGLGSLAASSELTVMRAAGVSILRIGSAILKPTAILMLLNLGLSEWVLPELEPIAQDFKAQNKGRDTVMSNGGRGYWHRENNVFMRFANISRDGEIFGISQFTFGDNYELLQIRRAKQASPTDTGFLLKQVTTIYLQAGHYQQSTQDTYQWQTDLTPESLSLSIASPQDMSLYRLYHYVDYLDAQGVNSSQYAQAMWRKILQPLSAFVLVLLGMSFIFGPLRSATAGYRIFSGILAGLVYKYTQDMLSPVALIAGLPAIWASLLPIAICAIVTFFLLRRA